MSKQQNKSQHEIQEEDQTDLPGYPLYPPEDDITRNSERVDGNLGDESFDDKRAANSSATPAGLNNTEILPEQETPASEYEVTEEDLEALGPVDLSLDLGEDEQLKQRSHPVDFAGEDLDVPGTSDDDANEQIGSEDEENNPYSLGGDAKSDLEEGH